MLNCLKIDQPSEATKILFERAAATQPLTSVSATLPRSPRWVRMIYMHASAQMQRRRGAVQMVNRGEADRQTDRQNSRLPFVQLPSTFPYTLAFPLHAQRKRHATRSYDRKRRYGGHHVFHRAHTHPNKDRQKAGSSKCVS